MTTPRITSLLVNRTQTGHQIDYLFHVDDDSPGAGNTDMTRTAVAAITETNGGFWVQPTNPAASGTFYPMHRVAQAWAKGVQPDVDRHVAFPDPPTEAVDYRRLLWKYIGHVATEEGVTFLEDKYRTEPGGSDDWVTDAEWAELVRVADLQEEP